MYFNPKCGTCRDALTLLLSKGIRPELIEYLKNPPSVGELNQLWKSGLKAEDIVRKRENLYAEMKLAEKKLSSDEWTEILSKNPTLIERPIVIKGNKAIVARPAEKVLDLF